MPDVCRLAVTEWNGPFAQPEPDYAVRVLERGGVVLLPQLEFPLRDVERALMVKGSSPGSRKNVSFDPAKGHLRGSTADDADQAVLAAMTRRYAAASKALLGRLLPHYAGALVPGRTSYRPFEVAGRSSSWRKDDTRLHVDSFPSSPTGGRRIMRVFSNLNPEGRSRRWRLGEPFEAIAAHFVGSIHGPVWGSATALRLLGVTKRRRSAYDHYMLALHDSMKADSKYQRYSKQDVFEFPAGATWIVYTDQVSHAAIAGQFVLEQTFYLPVQAMLEVERSPLRVLERRIGRKLASV
ncbi:MAG: Kdo hydroxylase family protein [Burkholderiales bacterium]|nr:Kdo hydroxylase family protein [Burkholderiales bacterium]MDE2394135.1 Kdo hydroxylase family protein [Burkholderiales bacterium]